MKIMKHIEVVAGVIEHDGKILCMERDQGKYDYVSFKWEFPGGKIEEGETAETGWVLINESLDFKASKDAVFVYKCPVNGTGRASAVKLVPIK